MDTKRWMDWRWLLMISVPACSSDGLSCDGKQAEPGTEVETTLQFDEETYSTSVDDVFETLLFFETNGDQPTALLQYTSLDVSVMVLDTEQVEVPAGASPFSNFGTCLKEGETRVRAESIADPYRPWAIADVVCLADGSGGGGGTGATGVGGSGAGGSGGGGGAGGGGGNGCATGEETVGPVSVVGTSVDAMVSAGDCPVTACSVTVVSNHTGFLTMTQEGNMGPVTFLKDGLPFIAAVVAPSETVTLDVEISDCATSQVVTKQLEFTDEANNFETYGPVDVEVTVTAQ